MLMNPTTRILDTAPPPEDSFLPKLETVNHTTRIVDTSHSGRFHTSKYYCCTIVMSLCVRETRWNIGMHDYSHVFGDLALAYVYLGR